mmetsp:Transcript_45829/g.136940  ORF Transcript_45829/g.136940 Transcript_45829/m.136940 type:complete len:202 (+) Transcript_45829:303-908(+)
MNWLLVMAMLPRPAGRSAIHINVIGGCVGATARRPRTTDARSGRGMRLPTLAPRSSKRSSTSGRSSAAWPLWPLPLSAAACCSLALRSGTFCPRVTRCTISSLTSGVSWRQTLYVYAPSSMTPPGSSTLATSSTGTPSAGPPSLYASAGDSMSGRCASSGSRSRIYGRQGGGATRISCLSWRSMTNWRPWTRLPTHMMNNA